MSLRGDHSGPTYLRSLNVHDLPSQRQHPRSPPRKVLEGIIIILRHRLEHPLQRLGRALHAGQIPPAGIIRHVRYGRHPLQRRRELEPPSDVDLSLMLGVLLDRRDLVTLVEFPLQGIEGSPFHGVTDDLAFLEEDQRVGGSERELGLPWAVDDGDELLEIALVDTGDTFDDEIFTGDRPGLVETADVDLSSEGNTERLGTENC